MKILVSVRDLDEARCAAHAGVHFIDLKEPAAGALGGLPPARIAPIVQCLRREAPGAELSATIGDWPAQALTPIVAACHAVAACGVDHVKVGVVPGPGALALADTLARLRRQQGLPIVPVLIADDGLPTELLARLLGQGFAALMLDTQRKTGGSLLARCAPAQLRRFVQAVQAEGAQAGLAGALRLADLPALQVLSPDFAGFRSAVCEGDRAAALSADRLAALVAGCPQPPALQACVQGA